MASGVCRLLVVVFVLLSMSAGGVLAQETPPTTAPADDGSQAPAVRGGAAQTERPDDWISLYDKLCEDCQEKYGTDFSLVVNGQGQLLLAGERRQGKGKSSFSYTAYVTQDLWKGAQLNVSAEGGSGRGLDAVVDSILGLNADAGEPECVYVSRLYLTQMLFDESLELAAGKLDLTDWFDSNAFANDENSQFLSPSLVNNPTIPFPESGLGALANWQLSELFYVMVGGADAQASATEMGTNTAFHGRDDFFGVAEAGFTPKIAGRQGSYRLLVWYDGQPVERLHGQSVKRDDMGLAVSFDQEFTDKLAAFFRYGFAHDDVREVSNFWSAGVQVAGPLSARPDDVLGVGVGQAVRSHMLRSLEGGTTTETLFETYYRIQINKHFSVSPNVQMILNPAGDRNNDTIVTVGVRLVLEL